MERVLLTALLPWRDICPPETILHILFFYEGNLWRAISYRIQRSTMSMRIPSNPPQKE